MPNLDQITTEVSFHGEDIIDTLNRNFMMYDSVWAYAKQQINAKVKVHISPRLEDHGPIEWSMSITSMTGRKTLSLSQRTPTGSVSIQPG